MDRCEASSVVVGVIVVCPHFQSHMSLKSAGQFYSNFIQASPGRGKGCIRFPADWIGTLVAWQSIHLAPIDL